MIDASQAFKYARGAMWHLEVAVPELRAAAGGAARASELTSAASMHLDDAVRSLAAAASHAPGVQGVGDAALGQVLSATARQLRSGGTSASAAAAADLAAAARLRVQQSIDALAPRLRGPEELLDLVPASAAPQAELALVDDIASARLFRRTSSVQRDHVKWILANGTVDPEPIRWVGGYGNGNGAMPMVRVHHPETPHLSVVAVQRPPTAQAAQEEFFARLAENAGVDHHFAPVVRREDGSALVLAVPGGASWENGVHGGDDVQDLLGYFYSQRFPSLTVEQVDEAARIDFDKLRTPDFVTAQPDRNGGAPLVDRAAGDVRYIDNGFAGRGETADPLMPGLKSQFMGGTPGHVDLHPTAARELSQALDDAALADAHAVLGRGPDGDLPSGHAFALQQDAGIGYLEAMKARRDQVATGSFDYHPIELMADPLAHMDWLRSQVGAPAW